MRGTTTFSNLRTTTCRHLRRKTVEKRPFSVAFHSETPTFTFERNYFRPHHRRGFSSAASSNNDNSASSPSSSSLDPFITRYLSRQQIDVHWHSMIVGALEPVYGKPLTVKHLKSFGNDGLNSLVQSLQQTYPITDANLQKRKVCVRIPHHFTEYTLRWREHESLLELANRKADLLGEYMEGTCGGTMACCSCHLYVSDNMMSVLEPPTEAEMDMLDLAYQPQKNSRLGCQVRLNEALLELSADDSEKEKCSLEVTIPADVHNVWN